MTLAAITRPVIDPSDTPLLLAARSRNARSDLAAPVVDTGARDEQSTPCPAGPSAANAAQARVGRPGAATMIDPRATLRLLGPC